MHREQRSMQEENLRIHNEFTNAQRAEVDARRGELQVLVMVILIKILNGKVCKVGWA
jgi:hypothetical protein